MKLVITVDCTDPSDLDFMRTRLVAAVEEEVEDNKDDGRLDGEVEVSWDMED